jgi:hypothetical protein
MEAGSKGKPVYHFITYSKVPGEAASIGNNDIQFIYIDNKNQVWLATSGGGLCLSSPGNSLRSLKFRNYTSKDGLPNDFILSMAEDKSNHLWLATENGLSRFSITDQQFRNYDSYDGLPRANFFRSICMQDCKRLINFGTTKGYTLFDPLQTNKTRIPQKLFLPTCRSITQMQGLEPKRLSFPLILITWIAFNWITTRILSALIMPSWIAGLVTGRCLNTG